MTVRMMDKGEFDNARNYATSVYGGTLSLWLGAENNGAIVREDSLASQRSFRWFKSVDRAQAYFIERQTSKYA